MLTTKQVTARQWYMDHLAQKTFPTLKTMGFLIVHRGQPHDWMDKPLVAIQTKTKGHEALSMRNKKNDISLHARHLLTFHI